MSVNKGDKMTAAQINELIDKINHEAERRGYTKKVAKVTPGSPISFDTINAINLNRIEIAKIYRAGYENIKSCIQRTDKTGTPSKWDGRDLQEEILNEKEQPLKKGNKPYASQFNLLEADINNLNAMCGCNSYKETRGCNCQSECSCQCTGQDTFVDCGAEYLDCGCVSQATSQYGETCQCESQSCGSNCNCVGTCTCVSHCSCNKDCGCDSDTCSCDSYSCSCYSHTKPPCNCDSYSPCSCQSNICSSESCICQKDSVCGCDGD